MPAREPAGTDSRTRRVSLTVPRRRGPPEDTPQRKRGAEYDARKVDPLEPAPSSLTPPPVDEWVKYARRGSVQASGGMSTNAPVFVPLLPLSSRLMMPLRRSRSMIPFFRVSVAFD